MDLFYSVYDSVNLINVEGFLLCIVVSLILGIIIAKGYMKNNDYNQGFVQSLAILPSVISIVIMMVNGSVGTGVAVAGAFSLVRFRSIPGNSKEICAVFLTMCTGVMIGVGYIGLSVLFVLLLTIWNLCLMKLNFGRVEQKLVLSITIPEDLNFNNVFDDLFIRYLTFYKLTLVKTTGMGSMFKLKYDIQFNNENEIKEFIDAIRCRNGNLEVSILNNFISKNEL